MNHGSRLDLRMYSQNIQRQQQSDTICFDTFYANSYELLAQISYELVSKEFSSSNAQYW